MASVSTQRSATGRGRRSRRASNPEVGTAIELRSRRYLSYSSIPSALRDSLRTMVTRYELRTGGPLPSEIVLTSALDGEGTTMVSQALAALLAHEQGKYVCWVDCSWLRVRSSDEAGNHAVGLIEMLNDHSKMLSAFESSPELPQLTCLRVGPVPADKRHMIVRSPEFERLMSVLAEEFDHVILDTPPLLGAGDGLPLLRRTLGYFLVVRQRSASETEVRRAIELTLPTPILGIVLTDYHTKIPRFVQRLFGE